MADFLDKAKINSQIQNIQKNKTNLFQNLGELVYNLHINGVISVEQCAGMCNEITSQNNTIAELQKMIEELEMKKNLPVYEAPAAPKSVCPICASVNPSDSRFCAICGAEIPSTSKANCAQVSGVICSNCKAVNEKGSKFCFNCGFAISEEIVAKQQTSSIYTSEPKPEMAGAVCSNCETLNEPGARFCAGCGYDMTVEDKEIFYTSKDDTPEGSVCPNCLTNNEVDARFCATCGTQLV